MSILVSYFQSSYEKKKKGSMKNSRVLGYENFTI